ncbi:unnamed protein product, partial [Effrenium voratum]
VIHRSCHQPCLPTPPLSRETSSSPSRGARSTLRRRCAISSSSTISSRCTACRSLLRIQPCSPGCDKAMRITRFWHGQQSPAECLQAQCG